MSALFTDPHRKCVACGKRCGVWPIAADGDARCPVCGEPQGTSREYEDYLEAEAVIDQRYCGG